MITNPWKYKETEVDGVGWVNAKKNSGYQYVGFGMLLSNCIFLGVALVQMNLFMMMLSATSILCSTLMIVI